MESIPNSAKRGKSKLRGPRSDRDLQGYYWRLERAILDGREQDAAALAIAVAKYHGRRKREATQQEAGKDDRSHSA